MSRELVALEQGAVPLCATHSASATNTPTTFAVALSQYPGERKYLARMQKYLDTPLDDITDEAIKDGVWEMYGQRSEETQRRGYWGPLRAFFNWAADQGRCKPREIEVPVQSKPRVPRPLTVEEEALLIPELADHVRPVVLLILRLGFTVKDALRLKWREVKLVQGKIYLGARYPCWVPLDQDIVADLKKLPYGEDPVFRTPCGYKYVIKENTGGEITAALSGACKRAGIRRVTARDLRDAWAIRLLQAGCSPEKLLELGGWQEKRSIRRYLLALAEAQSG
jgi:integrase